MNIRLSDTLSIVSILCLAVFATYLYPRIPEPMAIHWGWDGLPDGYASKLTGVVLLICLPAVTYALLRGLIAVSRAGYRMDQSRRSVGIITAAVTILMAGFCTVPLLNAAGSGIRMPVAVTLLIGALFVVLGNSMGKLERNWIIGIRTPWTLASDEVWAGTHRFGRWLFVGAGLLLLGLPLGPWPLIQALLAVVVVVSLVAVLYSFVLHLKIKSLLRH